MANSNHSDGAVRITLIGVGINLVLTGLKFGVGLATGSMALIADGIHSLSDLATDVVVLGGLRLSRRPADRSHAYGHGKFETVATTLVALALFAAGGWIAGEAVTALIEGQISIPGPIVAGVAALSVIGKEWLFRATRRVARRLRSTSLEANAWHHRSDAFSSVAVLVGGLAATLGFPQGDQAAAIAVALLIGWAAVGILRRALYELTEGALSEAEQGQVARAIATVDGVRSWHKLRTRHSGQGAFVDLHIQVNPRLSVEESHAIASRVERVVGAALGGAASVVVHVEPADVVSA
ncbi:MAG: cation diffusion facilitator family transporter [Candidatus Bipolaricaulota bacterium]